MKAVDFATVAARVRESARDKPAFLVSVDGLPGSGKSTLCREISSALSATHVAVDSFVEPGNGEYVAYLREADLRDQIRISTEAGGIVLLDGICIAAILERLAIVPDLRVYVLRLDDRDEWFDGEIFTSGLTEQQALAQEKAAAAAFEESLSPVRREVIRYHFAFGPQDKADAVYAHHDAPEA